MEVEFFQMVKNFGRFVSNWKFNSIIFTCCLLFTLAFSQARYIVVEASPTQEYQGPVFCAKCHPEEFENWNQTAHAHAFEDLVFQEVWKSQGSPDVCLRCHTTGFEMETGEFSFDYVGCETCHGPGGQMNLNTSAAFCSSCHSFSHYPTYQEWLKSEHGHVDVECVSCHDPMSLDIVVEYPAGLCGSCHESVLEEALAGEHGAKGLTCVDCHMVKSLADFENAHPGMTGHTFLPGVPDPDCESCHDVVLEAHDVWGAESDNCITCHDAVYMTMLHLLNGTELAISESSVLCKQCHNEVYYEWEMGIHADPHEREKECTDCHSPMKPYIMMNATLPPLQEPTQRVMVARPPIPPAYFFLAVAIVGGVGFVTLRRKVGGP